MRPDAVVGCRMVADMKVRCETANVANYESFWLATAAAAPVIALAAVVALPDTSALAKKPFLSALDDWFDNPAMIRSTMLAAGAVGPALEVLQGIDFSDTKAEVKKMRTYVLLRVVAAAIRWVCICNVMMQATLLAFSLATLAYNVDVMSRWLAIVLTVSGILLLTVTVWLVSGFGVATATFPEILVKQMTDVFKELVASDEFRELLADSEIAQGTAEE